MDAAEKALLLLSIWLVAGAIYRMRKWTYAQRTKHWIPLSGDTVWMVDKGHRLEYAPSPIQRVALAGALSMIVVLL